jgi:hypothetical protein
MADPKHRKNHHVAQAGAGFYHSAMKYALAIGLALAGIVAAHGAPNPASARGAPAKTVSAKTSPTKIKLGSRVPSLTVQDAGIGDHSYIFSIQNNSGHAVTAFDLLLVPSGVPRQNGHYVCQGRCQSHAEVGDIESPLIAAGDNKRVTYPADSVEGGAVIIEAAVFDDGTYGGSERTSALLVAAQLGFQAEFDRIVSVVDTVVNGASPQETKSAELDSTVAALPVDADGNEIDAFSGWFPNVQDCVHHFPQIMQIASSTEKTNLQTKLQQLLSHGTPTERALTGWWTDTQKWLGSFGCNGCAAKLDAPSPPAQTKTVSIGCSAPSSGGGSGTSIASGNSVQAVQPAASDDGSGDSSDLTAQNDSDADDSAGQDAGDDQLAMTEDGSASGSTADSSVSSATPATIQPAAPPALSPPADTAKSPAVALASRCKPIAPRPFGVIGIAAAEESERESLTAQRTGLATDDQLYHRYLPYVTRWEQCFADGQWPASAVEDYPDPYPTNFNGDQKEMVRVVAEDWMTAEQEYMKLQRAAMSQVTPSTQAIRRTEPTTWAEAKEQMQQQIPLRFPVLEERTKLIEAHLQSLRLGLGKAAFGALNTYAYGLYEATPARRVREPLPEEIMIQRYLRYIALMDRFAAKDDEDGRAAAQDRVAEQKASGLSKEDERKLQEAADTLQEMTAKLRSPSPRGQVGTTRPGFQSAGTTGDPRAEAISSVPVLTLEEREKLRDERHSILEKNLSEAGVAKVKKRVHELYDDLGRQRLVAVEPEPKTIRDPASTNAVTSASH